MIALLLSIVASTFIFVVFKLFDRFRVNTFNAIVVNYVAAGSCGLIAFEDDVSISAMTSSSWFYFAALLGVLFIVVFNLMALTTQRSGLSVVSVATKMSVVIPVVFGLWYYKESLGFLKATGILLALVAVYLVSVKGHSAVKISRTNLILPLLVFLGSGIIDTSIKYLENTYVGTNEVPLFSATIFLAAAVIGIGAIVVQAMRGKFHLNVKNIVGGIVLGIPNYFSVYFLVQALRSDILESSGIFTVNNVAIVMTSTLVGIIAFRENLMLKNWIGIALAIVSIFLIAANTL
ncbi:MAG: EamA family transporter [Flavobacteriaceae bacterium]|nr:EamA family transporter [Flavobacteriaceae bacterium]